MRGEFKNKKYARQLVKFTGLRYGNITPTDIDAFIDFKDKVFIFIEVKHGEIMPETGQRLALERLVNTAIKDKKSAVALIATHNTSNDIELAGCNVFKLYRGVKWRNPIKPFSVKQFIDVFLSWAENKEAA